MLPRHGCSSPVCASSFGSALSRRLLRHLILGHGLGVGARVFDTGRDGGRFTAFLRELQLDALGWDDLDLRWPGSGFESLAGSDEDALDQLVDDGPFDMILARDLPFLQTSLLSASSLAASLQLLGALRPGGSLILLGRYDADSARPDQRHRTECYLQHLRQFPGRCEAVQFADGLLHSRPWRWFGPRQPRWIVATLRLPAIGLTAGQWRAASEVAAQGCDHGCCPAFSGIVDRSYAA